jgi:methionyl-tRNA formyltransferase
MLNFTVLFFGKHNDHYSLNFLKILKKNFRKVTVIWDVKKKQRAKTTKKFDYIFSFRSHFILNKTTIAKAKIYAINFHPGPPDYRGIGCVNFALLNNEKNYGATVHLINEKIDNGKIIIVNKFKILKKYSVLSLLKKTYITQLDQLKFIIKFMKLNNGNLNSLINNNRFKWSKKLYTREQLNKLYEINNRISKKKFINLIRATVTDTYKPFISFFNSKFFYENT